MSKNELLSNSEARIKQNLDILMCPVCGNKLCRSDLKSIYCQKNHCFDISRRGYVNLLLKPAKSPYDRKMFESRNKLCRSLFFSPVIERISGLIIEEMLAAKSDSMRILDAGCGEGSHLTQLIARLQGKTNSDFLGVGVDISKEGVQMASRDYPGNIWCIADLAKLPFMAGQFNVVLNILSPANYAEFSRIIADEGLLIKVVPGSDYLKELRSLFYSKTGKHAYSNEKVIKNFRSNFNTLSAETIEYKAVMNQESFGDLINMTPLSWGVSLEKIKKALNLGIHEVTVDLTIVLGKKMG